LVDCGHSRNLGWAPGKYLKSKNIGTLELLCVTNYDEDHVSGLPNLLAHGVSVLWLCANRDVTPDELRAIKGYGNVGLGMMDVLDMLGTHTTLPSVGSPMPQFGGLKRTTFHAPYPTFVDTNNLSLVVHLECNGVGVLFPGDLERPGWRYHLRNPAFQDCLRRTSVFVASHHGRDDGRCDEAFDYLNPFYTVISDCGYQYESQETINYYANRTKGGPFRQSATRRVLTTRNDGTITFNFNADGTWGPG
jgi:beta-lactamase superfamily II metal-dependent hydrolase